MAHASPSHLVAVDTNLEPGDRFEVAVAGFDRLTLPETFTATGASIQALEDESGRPLTASVGPLPLSICTSPTWKSSCHHTAAPSGWNTERRASSV